MDVPPFSRESGLANGGSFQQPPLSINDRLDRRRRPMRGQKSNCRSRSIKASVARTPFVLRVEAWPIQARTTFSCVHYAPSAIGQMLRLNGQHSPVRIARPSTLIKNVGRPRPSRRDGRLLCPDSRRQQRDAGRSRVLHAYPGAMEEIKALPPSISSTVAGRAMAFNQTDTPFTSIDKTGFLLYNETEARDYSHHMYGR